MTGSPNHQCQALAQRIRKLEVPNWYFKLSFEPIAICDEFCSPTFSAPEARKKIAHGVSRGFVHQERKSPGRDDRFG
jgi:hypothetical protein